MRSWLTLVSVAVLASCTTLHHRDSAMPVPDRSEPRPMPSAPLDDTALVTRIALGSCFAPQLDHAIWDRVRDSRPDVFLFLGDNVYQSEERNEPELRELREAYALLANSDAFARLRSDLPVLVTWDDHDYGLNDAGGDWPHKRASEKLFEYVWAVPSRDPRRARDGVYYSRTLGPEGRRVQIVMLDTRFFRSPLARPEHPGKARFVPDHDPEKTLLGEAQWSWLEETLSTPAELRLIVSSIQIVARGHGWERWGTLPHERARLFRLIEDTRASGVVLISGDRHASAIYRETEGVPYPITELTSSSLNLPITGPNALTIAAEPGPNRISAMYSDENYGVVNIDWDAGTVTLKSYAKDGKAVHTETISIANLQTQP